MRTITLYNHGLTMGTAPKNPNRNPPKRGTVNGWTPAAARRNIAFLRSVDDEAIWVNSDGEPLTALALTFTIKDCPPTNKDWQRLLDTLFKRLKRLGMYRHHYVTEWQRRGAPHVHACVFFPECTGTDYAKLNQAVMNAWLQLTEQYGSKPISQNITPVYDPVGWFQYQSKHASRGVKHYQRSNENLPKEWQTTGRLWGKGGDWPLTEPHKLAVDEKMFFTIRRLVRNWRLADARKAKNPWRIRSARRLLKNNDAGLSKLRGISEWLNKESSLSLLQIAKEIHS